MTTPPGYRRTLPEQGMASAAVIDQLRAMRERDLAVDRATAYHYESGLTDLRPLLAEATATALGTNGLDPTAFPSVAAVENDLVSATAQIHGGGPDTVGTVTSGGTESCMLAVLGARQRWRARNPDAVSQPTVVMSVSAHPAFRKGAWLAGMEVVDVGCRPASLRMDVTAMTEAIDDRTALVVVSAPEYAMGGVDPVADVAAAAMARGVPCHLDMCIGGWVLPFIQQDEGSEVVGMSVEGVTSMSADLHKYAYGPKGVSVLLHADADMRAWHWFADAAWPGYPFVNNTLLSSRSTAPAAGAWAVLHRLGVGGLRQLALKERAATVRLAEAIGDIDGLRVAAEPAATLLAIADDGRSDDPDVRVVADEMGMMGWPLQIQPARAELPTTIHITMTGAVADQLADLVEALREATDRARRQPRPAVDQALVAAAESIDPTALDEASLDGLLDLAGFRTDESGVFERPQRQAGTSAMLEAVPPALVERLLIAVLGRVYRPAGG
jgi:sphinganine-1-phosphate aldolase